MKESRVEQTIARHDKGYNCAQAVACTYCDLFGMEEKTVFQLSEGFGAGMGGMQSTCGALSGAIMTASMKISQGPQEITKGKTYQMAKELTKRFEEQNGSSICKELKGLETGKVLRSCPDCIRDAARLVEEMLVDQE